jgi:hypothetical protein
MHFKELFLSLQLEDYVLTQEKSSYYGLIALIKMHIVLTVFNYTTYKEKTTFLKDLHQNGLLEAFFWTFSIQMANPERLKQFQQNLEQDVLDDGSLKIFQHSTTYVVPSESSFHYACMKINDLEALMNGVFSYFSEVEVHKMAQESGFFHVAVDGKDVRQSSGRTKNSSDKQGLKDSCNIKMVNLVSGKYLIQAHFMKQEAHWIKETFSKMIPSLQKELLPEGKPILISADAIYNTPTIRSAIEESGLYYSFPTKKNSGPLLRTIQESFIRKAANSIHFEIKYNRKNEQILDQVVFLEMENRKALVITRTFSTKGIIHNTEKLYQISNFPFEYTLEGAKRFYDLKREHWVVESFHKIKDVLLGEDDYQKSPSGAKAQSIINNFAVCMLNKILPKISKFALQSLQTTLIIQLLKMKNLMEAEKLASITKISW